MPQRFRVAEQHMMHFITSATTHWIPVFTRDDYFRILVDSLVFCAREKGLRIYCYVIMPNHFHLICSSAEADLSETIRQMKSFTSRNIAEKLRIDGRTIWLSAMTADRLQRRACVKVWQDEFHPEEIRTQRFFDQKLNYIHNNPVRAGFVDDPAEWKYSSAGFYYKDRASLVPITPIMW